MNYPRIALAWLVIWLPALTACGAKDNQLPAAVKVALEKADSLELYSLDPSEAPADKAADDKAPKFHDWSVLGSTVIKEMGQREKLIAALQKGVAENDGIAAACFNPRHGIRAKHAGKVYDVVICFECLSAAVFIDDKRESGFLLTRSPQPTFDATLKAAGVALPKSAKE